DRRAVAGRSRGGGLLMQGKKVWLDRSAGRQGTGSDEREVGGRIRWVDRRDGDPVCDSGADGRWRLSPVSPLWSDLAHAWATRSDAVARDMADHAESAAVRNCDSSGRRGLQPGRRAIDPSWMSLALLELRQVRR